MNKKKRRLKNVFRGLLHLFLLREIKPPEAGKPTWAQGIEAEIPEARRGRAEELERIARFFAA
jgi:hypothetical protein